MDEEDQSYDTNKDTSSVNVDMENMKLSNWRDISSSQADKLKKKSNMVKKLPDTKPFQKPSLYKHRKLNDPKARATALSSKKEDPIVRILPVLPDTDNTSTVLNKCSKLLSDIARHAVEKVFLEKYQHNAGHLIYILKKNMFSKPTNVKLRKGISKDRVRRVAQYYAENAEARPERRGGARNIDENNSRRNSIIQLNRQKVTSGHKNCRVRSVLDVLEGKRKNDLELDTMVVLTLEKDIRFTFHRRFLEYPNKKDRSFTESLWNIDYYNSWFLCVNKEAIAKEELYYMWQVVTEAVVCISGEDFTTEIETLAKSESCKPLEIPDKKCTRTSENSNDSKSTVSQNNAELFSTTAHLHIDERNLHYNIKHGHTEVVELLIKDSAEFDIINDDRESPLYVASKHGHTDIIKLLLQYGAEVNMMHYERESPLHVASKHGLTDIVTLLLHHGAKVDVWNYDGESPLYVASKHGHTDVVKLLLQHGAEVNIRNNEGQSPLYVASKHGRTDAVTSLLQHGAKVNVWNYDGESPLYVASNHGHTDVVTLLLQNGAKVNVWNYEGESPLYVASKRGLTDIVTLLLHHGAKEHVWNYDGESPLYVASKHGHTDVVTLLLYNGAKVNVWNYEGESPLYVASKHGHTDVVTLLLHNGTKVNVWNREGESPICVASMHGHNDVVKLLLQNGAEVNIRNCEGQSPLYVASKHGHTDVEKLLLQHGARTKPLFLSSQLRHVNMEYFSQHHGIVDILDHTILDDRIQEIFKKIEVSVPVPDRRYALPNGKIYHIYFIYSTSDEEQWVQSTIEILKKYGYKCSGRRLYAINDYFFEKIEKESSIICLVLSRCFMSGKNPCLNILLTRPFQGIALRFDNYGDTDFNFSDLTIIDVPYPGDSDEDKIEWFKELLKQLHNKEMQDIMEIANGRFDCNAKTAFRVKCKVADSQPIQILIFSDEIEQPINTSILENTVKITNPKLLNISFKESQEEEGKLTREEMFTAKCIIQANSHQLFQNHKNLNIISVSPFRLKQSKNDTIPETCIVLYCYCKGLIPEEETEFPEALKFKTHQLPVDVREGFFELGANYKTGPSTIYHEKIKIGCGMSMYHSGLEGSIGPLLKCYGGIGFLTCAHTTRGVENDNYHWKHQNSNVDFPDDMIVLQPPLWPGQFTNSDFEKNKVGKVVEVIFKPNCEGLEESSIDVGLVKITNTDRIPQRGEFAVSSPSNLEEISLKELPIFEGSVITDPLQLDPDRRTLKFGMKTHGTRGIINFDGIVVRAKSTELASPNQPSFVVTFKNQYEVGSITTCPVFFQGGDSGSAVFQLEKRGDKEILHLIGIAIGHTSYNSAIVTPIQVIMAALQIDEKAFKLNDDADVLMDCS